MIVIDYKVVAHSEVRHPPFESSLMIPERLPTIRLEQVLGEAEEEEEAKLIAEQQLPGFRIGEVNSWYIERRLSIEGPDGKEEFNSEAKVRMETRKAPLVVERQRTGWYLSPNPIHRYARWFLIMAVIVLLTGLLMQTLEPMLMATGILPEAVLGGVRFGLLDYPFMVVIILPLMIVPYVMRLIANVRDLKRQREFLSSDTPSPDILFLGPVVADAELECKITFENPHEGWTSLKVWWQVGALPPIRETVMEILAKEEEAQPPPGFSTPLPHYWEQGLSDGGGFGEDTPLMEFDAPGGLFLRPLRMMEWGGMQELPVEGGKVKLQPPKPDWPGTYYGTLLSVHWEMVIRIDRENHGPLYWVHPLKVAHGMESVKVLKPHINDGRIEDSMPKDESRPVAA